MYHEQKFGISPIEDIESDLKEMSEQYPKNLKRIFWVCTIIQTTGKFGTTH